MALLDLPGSAPAVGELAAGPRRGTGRAPAVAVLLLLGWCGTALVVRTGGREPHVLSVGLVLLLGALAAVRPWRLLPPALYGGLCAVGGAAFLVVLLAPTGWSGANEAASWVFASQVAGVVLAWATTELRRAVLLAGLALSSVLTFAAGWLAWWGGQDPTAPFLGTFYWHNQEGVYLAVGAVLALFGVLRGPRPTVPLAWLVAVLCGTGVLLTTSRAAGLVLAVGALLVAATVLAKGQARLRGLVVVAAAPVLVAATGYLLTGPPFFPLRSSPLAGTAARAATGQSVAVNGGHRLDDWVFAVKTFVRWPVTGTGFHGFSSGSKLVDPAHRGSLTPFAHNGFLQLLVDGGVVLALPVLALLVVLCSALVRQRCSLPPTGVAGAVALVVLALHSAVDFDWSYPALLVAFALAAAVTAAAVGSPPACHRSRAADVLAVAAVLLVVLSCAAAWHGALHLNVPIGGRT